MRKSSGPLDEAARPGRALCVARPRPASVLITLLLCRWSGVQVRPFDECYLEFHDGDFMRISISASWQVCSS